MKRTANGSAQSGLGEWVVQRVTALYLAGFVIWLVLRLSLAPAFDYPAWTSWFAQGGIRAAFALAFVSMLLHAWVGVRSILLDYIKPFALRLGLQLAMALLLMAQAYWAAQIVFVEAVR